MRQEILGLQYLRGVAALAVVWDHAVGMAAFPKYFGEEVAGFEIFREAALGVPLFFMISGFIIAVVSLQQDLSPGLTRSSYFFKRAIRILPIMWIAILSYAGLRYVAGIAFDPVSVLRTVLLSPVGDMEPNNIWTLRHEAIFYIVFALTFLGPRSLRWLMPVWVCLPLVYALLDQPSYPAPGGMTELLWVLAHPANLLFGCGLVVGLIYKRIGGTGRQLRALLPMSLAWFCAVLTLIWWLEPAIGLVKFSIAGVLFLPLLCLNVFFDAPLNRFWKLMGDASFSIYLFHPHVESIALTLSSRLIAGKVPVEVACLIVAIVAVVCTVLIYCFVEVPVTSWLRGQMSRPSRVRA